MTYSHGLNKGFNPKFPDYYPDEHSEEGQRAKLLKCCDNIKDVIWRNANKSFLVNLFFLIAYPFGKIIIL